MALEAQDLLVEISDDGMEAFVTLQRNPSADISPEDLRAALNAAGVVSGILEEELARLCRQPQKGQSIRVAEGTRPRDGGSDEIVYSFPIDSSERYEEEGNGSIDFRNARNFNSFRAGEVLVLKKPGQPGSDGCDVRGKLLPARAVQKANLRAGKGALLEGEGSRIVAEFDGHACLQDGSVRVISTVEVLTDVDYSVGNITFVGNVNIRGNVMPGFSVEAEGKICIDGNVDNANIRCGGDLEIRGIVFGHGECRIDVDGNAHIGAVDQAELRIGGNLTIVNYLRHSEVLVGGVLELVGQKGNVVGGRVSAYHGIRAPYVGNPMATLTRINVGLNPFYSDRLARLEPRRARLEDKQNQLSAGVKVVQRRIATTGKQSSDGREILPQLAQALLQVQSELKLVELEVEEVLQQNFPDRQARVRVQEKAFPGVVLSFREGLQYKTKDTVQAVSFYEAEGEVRCAPY